MLNENFKEDAYLVYDWQDDNNWKDNKNSTEKIRDAIQNIVSKNLKLNRM